MKPIFFLIELLFASCGFAQKDTTKPARFAIVQLSLWKNNTKPLKNVYCAVQYSDGVIQDIAKILTLAPMMNGLNPVYNGLNSDDSILNVDEFKILSYFYDRGYEIILLILEYAKNTILS